MCAPIHGNNGNQPPLNYPVVGDALQVLRGLPDGCCDMGVTSPPYNKQENKKGWLVKNVRYANASDKKDECAYRDEQVAVLDELHRVIRPGGSFFYNHKVRWERGEMMHPMSWLAQTKWGIRQEIVWDRQIAANIRGWRFWQTDERIYWLYKPEREKGMIGHELASRHAKMTSVWRFPPERNNDHPAPFPLVLPLRAIYSIMNGGVGTVIDPWCGSGTTLVAARLLGCDCIGIDISEEYVQMAQNRLDNFADERAAAEHEMSQHQTTGSFDERKRKGKNVGKFAPHSAGPSPQQVLLK